jgi:hypothetical protein
MLLRHTELLPPAIAAPLRGRLLNPALSPAAIVPDGAYVALQGPATGPRRTATTRTA